MRRNPSYLGDIHRAFEVVAQSHGAGIRSDLIPKQIVEVGKNYKTVFILGKCATFLASDPSGKLLREVNQQLPEDLKIWGEFEAKDGGRYFAWTYKKHNVLRDEKGLYIIWNGEKKYLETGYGPIPEEEQLMPKRNPNTVPITTAGGGTTTISMPAPIVVSRPVKKNPHGISTATIKDATIRAIRSALAEAGEPISLQQAKESVQVKNGEVRIVGDAYDIYDSAMIGGGDIIFDEHLPKQIRDLGYFDGGGGYLFFAVDRPKSKKAKKAAAVRFAAARSGDVMVARWGGKECPRCSREIKRGDEIMDTGERGPRGGKVTAHAACVSGKARKPAKVKAAASKGRARKASKDQWAFQWIGGGWNTVTAESHNEALSKAKALGAKNGLKVKKGTLRVASQADMQMVAHNYRRNPVSALRNSDDGIEYPSAVFDDEGGTLYFTPEGEPYVIEAGRKIFIQKTDPRTKIFRDKRFLAMYHPGETISPGRNLSKSKRNPTSALVNSNDGIEYPSAVFDDEGGTVYFTSNGQPYVMEDGRPKFIKKSDPRTRIFRDKRFLAKYHPGEVLTASKHHPKKKRK